MFTADLIYKKEDLVLSLHKLPLELLVKKTQYRVNMNTFMRTHYRANHAMKVAYQRYVIKTYFDTPNKISPKPKLDADTYKLLFVYFRPNEVSRDLSNMLAIIDKFVTDVLVAQQLIPDDNVDYITDVHYKYGGIKPKQHYADLYVFRN